MSCLSIARMSDRSEFESRDSYEVPGIARIERHPMCDSAGCDECVVGPRRRFAPCGAQCCRHTAERSGAVSIERKYVEVRFGLLEVLLTGASLCVVPRDVRAHRQLGQRYRTDHRFVGKLGRVRYLTQEDHCGGIQHPPGLGFAHSDGSIRLSISRRSASGSTRGRFLRRRISSVGLALGRGRGRSSATGVPSRVMTMRSPCSTRRRTSPPLLRSSRTVTASIPQMYHR